MKYCKSIDFSYFLLASFFIFIISYQSYAQEVEEVNVYSARHYDTDMALYNEFTEKTGIKVNLIEGGSDALIERIVNEGEFSPADILITVDAGRIWRAQQKGIFQPISSETLNTRIPENLRDGDGFWYGLSKRARVIVQNKKSNFQIEIKDYEDLADPALKGQVCMRSSSNIYNLSLMSSLIEANGEQKAEAWANAVVNNFARSPQGNDTAQLRAVASGECGITVANTYYLGRLLGSKEEKDRVTADNLNVIFPNQNNRGSHVNISGAGITKYAPNFDNALKFLDYLTSDFAQKLFAEGNNEYPIVGQATGAIAKLGEFKEDKLNVRNLGAMQNQAVRLYDRAGWK
ncbi:MAG: Fe(3+) ABC transporter substrate-binding protein [Gammaproteobacteria bacterium]|nr:Fe(3+) ABC transporter substrate-binding protein [Gammaproteobacteria bacterium]|tara:strand:+ start:2971 stop:4008 length:1038 start_codon:yes stop_codon:yes gene_type:complete